MTDGRSLAPSRKPARRPPTCCGGAKVNLHGPVGLLPSYTLSLAKRGNGEGSIYQRADGIWCCALIDPGVRRKVIYGRTRQEVASKLRTALQAREAGTLADSRRMTVGEYLDTWLSEVVEPSARNWTYLGYETAVRLHLKPTLSRLRLDRLTPIQVQSLLNAKRPRDWLRNTSRTSGRCSAAR